MMVFGPGPKEGRIVDERVAAALRTDRTIDITTYGRRSGQPRRIETWLYRVGERFFLTGSPGRRDWYANLLANPSLVIHLKESVIADVTAGAVPVTGQEERRAALAAVLDDLGQPEDLEAWMVGSPLIEVIVG